MKPSFAYPPARRCDQVDSYFGTVVADPYRWLEDPDSPETKAWVEAQIALTEGFLKDIPERADIADRLRELFSYDKVSAPIKRGKRSIFSKHAGLADHPVYYVVDEDGKEPRLLLDPNTLSEHGPVSITAFNVSEDGNLLAYGVSVSGSDWREFRVRDINTGKDFEDRVKWSKFSMPMWSNDGKGFYYARFEEPVGGKPVVPPLQRFFYHTVGTTQSDDTLVLEDKYFHFHGVESEDGRYLLILVFPSTAGNNLFFFKDLQTGQIVKLLNKENAHWDLVGTDGPRFWFLTDFEAPRGRLVVIDTSKSTPNHLEMHEVIAEPSKPFTTLKDVKLTGNRFFAHYLVDVHSEIKELSLDGSFIRDLKLPGIGSVVVNVPVLNQSSFQGKRRDMEAYYTFTSYTFPGIVYKYDIAAGTSTVFFKPNIPIDPNNYTTKLIFAISKDGTRVPMFISYRKGLKRNGQNPTIAYGYGGFNVSMGPAFAASRMILMDIGGIYAETLLRGGGEDGEAWHLAGTKLQKQNTFDDFNACTEWLIDHKYTSTPKILSQGGSNGGTTVGACLIQRPDLYGGCIPGVPVMDMLRYHLFTGGAAWQTDYGCSETSEREFKALFAYSPYHNIKADVSYPATMAETADHDNRVPSLHAFKYIAALQSAQAGPAPILIRIEKNAGHGAGRTLTQQIEKSADEYSFLIKVLNIPQRKLRRLRQPLLHRG